MFLQWPLDSEERFGKKKEVEAKRIQGPRQLINVLLVSQQLKSTFLEARRYSSVLFDCRPARPINIETVSVTCCFSRYKAGRKALFHVILTDCHSLSGTNAGV